jgi:excisionase family DNA binding protein
MVAATLETLPPRLTVEQAAKVLGISERTIREHSRNRTIPMLKLAGAKRVMFPTAQLLEWLPGAALEVEESNGNTVVRLAGAVA